MNFYQHHIGDYASLTGHLSPIEDLAYRRALERYYKTEAPLELDTERVARLLRLADHREAVEAVLGEFFVETPAGWTNPRADEEIERMREKQDVADERDQHEKTRMQRHREKRAAMFAALAEVGIYPPFNAKTGELEKAMRDADVTLVVTPAPQRSDGTGYGTGDGGDKPATASRARSPEPQPSPEPEPVLEIHGDLAVASPPASPEERVSTALRISKSINELPGIDPPPLPSALPSCPHLEVLAAWRRALPEMPQHLVTQWKGTRAMHLRARWRETAVEEGWTTPKQGVEWFEGFFRWLRGSRFLMGQVPPRVGSKAFELELAWLVNPTNWAKTREGKFHGS